MHSLHPIRRNLLLVLLAMAPCGAAARSEDAPAQPAPAGISEREKQALEAVADLELERFGAMESIDVPALEKILADDVTYSHSTGAVETKTQFLTNLKEGKTKYVAITPQRTLVRGIGDDLVIITGKSDFHLVAGGRDIKTVLVHTSVYHRQKTGWQLVAWHSSAAPATIPSPAGK